MQKLLASVKGLVFEVVWKNCERVGFVLRWPYAADGTLKIQELTNYLSRGRFPGVAVGFRRFLLLQLVSDDSWCCSVLQTTSGVAIFFTWFLVLQWVLDDSWYCRVCFRRFLVLQCAKRKRKKERKKEKKKQQQANDSRCNTRNRLLQSVLKSIPGVAVC